jgi:nucleoside-diphosphate-sugar epimerase
MKQEKILVIGAFGQLGTELVPALRALYGEANVIASDVREPSALNAVQGPFVSFDVLDKKSLETVVRRHHITQIYLLAAMLSATGEQFPTKAWDLNMQSLINVLEVAKDQHLNRVFWPSSIAVFGKSSPKKDCPQDGPFDPTTVYGISKIAGEHWCNYYYQKYGVDVRSIRYPGLISYTAMPGGGTTDYAVDIFHQALDKNEYTCFLKHNTALPMMYMPDAVRATLELMEAPAYQIKNRHSYNIAGVSFTPAELAEAICTYLPEFVINYRPDTRQSIADSWPDSIDDTSAFRDWGWEASYGISAMTREMLQHLAARYPSTGERSELLHPAVFA